MKTKFLLFFLIMFSFSTFICSQETDSEESSIISVPESAMREVVSRILAYNFKPRTRNKVIFIAKEGINKDWLPEIQNVEFRLLTDVEIEVSGTDIYFFTKPEITKSTYEIGFAFGNPNCRYQGKTWSFKVQKNRVRLWLTNRGFGGGCVRSGPFGEFESPGNQMNFRMN